MASTLHGLLPQSRLSHSESSSKGTVMSVKEVDSGPRPYPGSLHRHQRSSLAIPQYRSMLDISETPTLGPIDVENGDSMEDWVAEKLNQRGRPHKTENWADILCFYTATNGAPAAPTRASPAPTANGKVGPPPQEIPQSVSSTDPKIAAQQASDMRNIVRRKLTGYVGFANLPNQWHRKSVRKGFNFNVMVVGTFKASNRKGRLFTDGIQVNLAWASLPWSTLSSIHPYTHLESAKDPASILFQKLFLFNLSAPILRRMVFVYV